MIIARVFNKKNPDQNLVTIPKRCKIKSGNYVFIKKVENNEFDDIGEEKNGK